MFIYVYIYDIYRINPEPESRACAQYFAQGVKRNREDRLLTSRRVARQPHLFHPSVLLLLDNVYLVLFLL